MTTVRSLLQRIIKRETRKDEWGEGLTPSGRDAEQIQALLDEPVGEVGLLIEYLREPLQPGASVQAMYEMDCRAADALDSLLAKYNSLRSEKASGLILDGLKVTRFEPDDQTGQEFAVYSDSEGRPRIKLCGRNQAQLSGEGSGEGK